MCNYSLVPPVSLGLTWGGRSRGDAKAWLAGEARGVPCARGYAQALPVLLAPFLRGPPLVKMQCSLGSPTNSAVSWGPGSPHSSLPGLTVRSPPGSSRAPTARGFLRPLLTSGR